MSTKTATQTVITILVEQGNMVDTVNREYTVTAQLGKRTVETTHKAKSYAQVTDEVAGLIYGNSRVKAMPTKPTLVWNMK